MFIALSVSGYGIIASLYTSYMLNKPIGLANAIETTISCWSMLSILRISGLYVEVFFMMLVL